jgi:hypothetical protein
MTNSPGSSVAQPQLAPVAGRSLTGRGKQAAATAILFAALGCALSAFLVWTASRGFDIWDEGFYLIMSRHPEDIGAFPGSYYYYTGLLFSLSGMDIATFRCLGIVCLLGSTIVLASGLRAIDPLLRIKTFSAGGLIGFVGLSAFLFLGTLIYYASMARTTPSYNLLTNLSLTAATGTVLLALAAFSNGSGFRAATWMFVTGLLLGLQFLTKPPPAVLMSAVILAITLLWPKTGSTAASRYRLLAVVAAGGVAWLIFHFALFETPRQFLDKVQLGLEYQRHLGVRINLGFLWDTVSANGKLLGSMLKQSWPAIILLALLLWSYKRLAGSDTRRLVPLCWIAVLGIVLTHIAARYYMGGYTANPLAWRQIGFYFFWAAALLGVLIFLARERDQNRRQFFRLRRDVLLSRDVLLIALLGAIPFIGGFGTTGPHQIVLAYNCVLAPWFGVLIFLAARVEANGLPLRIPAQIAVAGFAAAQLVTGYLGAPYGNTKGALDLRSATTVGVPPTTLLLAPEAHDAVEALKSAAARCGFKAGDRMLGFYGVPGIVYALGGRVVTFPGFTGYFWGKRAVSVSAAEAAMKALPYREAHDAFVITHLSDPELRAPDLEAIGRNHPDGYELCGEAVWPVENVVIKLWKPIGP